MGTRQFLRLLSSIIFPASCCSCHRALNASVHYSAICDACFSRIPRNPYPKCPTCGRRCTEPRTSCHTETPFVLLAATEFSAPEVRELIHALKYRGIRDTAEPLAELVAEHLTAALPMLRMEHESFLLIPAPLHPHRKRERGIDQTACIARALVERLPHQLTLKELLLVRTRNTDSQTGQPNRKARFANVAESFVLREPTLLTDANVLILDDVCTSGATMAEMVRAVRAARPRTVLGVVVAQA